MPTLVTPSAKSHERVTGRWVRDLQAESKRDWVVFYAKLVFGTPVPWIFTAFLCSIFISRAAVEITAWATGGLTAAYILIDRFASDREFRFFSLGSDFLLLGFLASALAGLNAVTDAPSLWDAIGSLRWIPLVYLLTYCWQLFPGLNRMFLTLLMVASLTAAYAVYQHFTGMDVLRGVQLEFAPLKEHALYMVTGFFRHPEILGTMMAVLFPLPAAAFMLSDRREKLPTQILALLLAGLLGAALFWTYKPGLWIAGGAGLIITMILQPRRQILLAAFLVALFGGLVYGLYGDHARFGAQIAEAEAARADNQRLQINSQLEIWSQNTWIGAGLRAEAVRATTSLDGNVYFQLLAQTGSIGIAFYLLFTLSFLLGAYGLWREIPRTHYWHRVLVSGGIGGLAAFHVAGLYWSTLSDSHATNLFALLLSSLAYLAQHYDHGLVPDDKCL